MLKNIKSVIENNITVYGKKPFIVYGERFFHMQNLFLLWKIIILKWKILEYLKIQWLLLICLIGDYIFY